MKVTKKYIREWQEGMDRGAADSIEMAKTELVQGRSYMLNFVEKAEYAGTKGKPMDRTVAKRYKLVKAYKHFAMMERNGGIEGFTYWELWKRMSCCSDTEMRRV